MKKRILIVVALLVSVALLATGAYAWFSSSASASGTITSGTLSLKIAAVVPSADCPAYGDITESSITLWNNTNLAPGDTFDGKICMANKGSLPIPQVGFSWTGFTGDLAEHIFVTKLYNSGNMKDEIADYILYYDKPPKDGKMSLAELQLDLGSSEQEYWVGGVPVFLPVGTGVQFVEYTLQFDPDAGNEFQGLHFDYNLGIMGYQKPKY